MITSVRFAAWHITVLIVVYVVGVSSATAAEVTAHKKWMLLEGKIESGDYTKFEHLVEQNSWLDQIFLASPGGSVAEAIQIGQLVRRLNLSTVVPFRLKASRGPELDKQLANFWGVKDVGQNYVCASACFFIHVAGISRTGNTLGIHRPFFDVDSLKETLGTEAIAQSQYARYTVDGYLQEMGVPSKYSDLMFSTRKDEIRWISRDEIDDDFSGPIPELADWIESRCGPNQLTALQPGKVPTPLAKSSANLGAYLDCQADNVARLHFEAWVLARAREAEAQINSSAQ